MKRGLVIGAALCVAALVAFFLLRGHGTTSSTASSGSATGSTARNTRSSRAVDIARTGRRIAGVVVGEDNQPIAGAHVQLASKETIRAPMIVTSADGAFDFGVKAPLVYAVFADAPKLTGAAYELDLGDAQAPSEKLRLVLHACDASIHGVVHDTVGGTVAGALVSRTAGRARSSTGALSDATGTYELCIPTGGEDIVVTADGYATVRENVNVFGRTARDFVLVPGGTVTGKVVRASDKTPVDGATIALREKDGDSELYATSNEDGTFTIDGVLPGRRVVSAYVDKLATLDPPEIAVEIGAPTEVTCEVSPVATLSGRLVLESDHSVGVPNMDVFLTPTTNQGDPRHSEKTATDGTFVFERVRPGDYEVSPRGAKLDKRTAIHVADADIADLTITTSAPASVAGRVLYQGKPVEGAFVESRAATDIIYATTDSEGKFLFDGLTSDTVQLYAQSTRLGAFTNGPSLALSPGEKKTGVDIPLDLAGSVAGVVVDQNNAPLSGVYVRFVLVGGRDQGEATTADDGSFTARAMSGGGDYVYEVRERADSPNVFPPTEGKRFPPVKVADGSTHITGLRLRVKRERLTISGRVVDEDGVGVSDVTVRAASTRMGGRFM
ncbi:MAG TPA: carboxypeptidase regulatory-like domain-containing protein, partial [Kofleriaceae bacterium]